MNNSAKTWMAIACVIGALAIGIGAFGAHGVPSYLEGRGFDQASIDRRLGDFETGARYQMYGALFVLGLSVAMEKISSRCFEIAAWAMVLGCDLFASVLYAVALVPDDMRGTFGRFAPIGGGLMIVAWVSAAVGAMRK